MGNSEQSQPEKHLDLFWYRRGRYLKISSTTPFSGLLRLSDLYALTGITRDEALIALDEAQAPKAVERIDTALHSDFDDLRVQAIPDDLAGKSVLDVGGYNGEFAPLCFERGATSYTVFDSDEYTDYGWAAPIKQPGVTYQRGDLMNFGWRAPRPADVVLCYNVIYHIRDFWGAMERLRLLCRERLVLCTSFVTGDEPQWHLFAHDDPKEKPINDSYTVFFRPTISGLLKLMRMCHFENITTVGVAGDHVVVTAN